MVSGQDHDRNNNFFDNCYQIQKLQRKGKGVIATKTLPGTITLSTQSESHAKYKPNFQIFQN